MSKVLYNGIDLSYARTATYEMVNQLDPTNGDRIFTEFTFGVESMLEASLAPAGEDETPAQIAKRIEHMLLTPRRRFLYITGGNTTIIDTDQDDENGPMPTSCKVMKLPEGAWQILWSCKIKLANCNTKPTPNDILSLKFATVADYDADWCGTRTTSGLLILSRRSKSPDLDSYRSPITPELLPGFRRESANYSASEDGLRIRFSFKDKQLHRVPPEPATSIQGEEGMHAPNPGGIIYQFVNLKLKAPPRTDIDRLFLAAMSIVQSRTAATAQDFGKGYLMDLRIVKPLSDNETSLSVNASWQVVSGVAKEDINAFAGGTRSANLPIEFKNWLRRGLPNEDKERAIGPPVSGVGDIPIRLIAAALTDPCGEQAAIDSPQSDSVLQNLDDGSTLSVQIAESDLVSGGEPTSISDQTPGVYVWWECVSHHSRDEGVSVMPSTKPGEPGRKVRLHNPTHSVRCEFTARRAGGPPELPDPTQSDSNIVLIRSTVSPSSREVGPDAETPVYTTTGIYDYEYLDATRSEISEPIPPFMRDAIRSTAGEAVSLLSSSILFNPGEEVWA